jgi:hypothetical protein
MTIDVAPLLQRLVLAGLPLAAAGCYCGELAPHQVFESTIAVFDDSYVVLQPGVARPGGDAGAGTADAGTANRFVLTPEMHARYQACVDRNDCRPFCEAIARGWFSTAVDIRACHLHDNGSDRPDVIVAGLGTSAMCGRRPAGLRAPRTVGGNTALGRYLAEAAHLEAASVPAFRRLADELAGHGAPARLCRAARRAARDEARHARQVTRLARAAGARPPRVSLAPPRPRSLAAMAAENAAEGCVRESFGALLAWWQAATAADAGARHVAARIAPDESQHASLAWEIDAWAHTRLPPAARDRVRAARDRAVAKLADGWGETLPAAVRVPLGLPDGPTARTLIDALTTALLARGPADARA